MSNVLIVAEQSSGQLRKATLHALEAGRQVAARTGGKLRVLVLGSRVEPLAQGPLGRLVLPHLLQRRGPTLRTTADCWCFSNALKLGGSLTVGVRTSQLTRARRVRGQARAAVSGRTSSNVTADSASIRAHPAGAPAVIHSWATHPE